MVCFHLKRSQCDQFGRGVDVFIGRSENELCPVTAILSYIARRGDPSGAFFCSRDGQPLTKANFITWVQGASLQGSSFKTTQDTALELGQPMPHFKLAYPTL